MTKLRALRRNSVNSAYDPGLLFGQVQCIPFHGPSFKVLIEFCEEAAMAKPQQPLHPWLYTAEVGRATRKPFVVPSCCGPGCTQTSAPAPSTTRDGVPQPTNTHGVDGDMVDVRSCARQGSGKRSTWANTHFCRVAILAPLSGYLLC